MFDAIGTAGTGLQSYHTWLDVIANNIANVNDTAPTNGKVFATQYVQASEIAGNGGGVANTLGAMGGGGDSIGQGVSITALPRGNDNGDVVPDPQNPIADAQGNVRRTDVDLSEQMGDMIMAQRAFQANASVVDRAKETYEAALNIGKGV